MMKWLRVALVALVAAVSAGQVLVLDVEPAHAALEIRDHVCETTTTTGTGTVDLEGAYLNYQPFSVLITDGATVRYNITSGDGKVETGVGTYTDAAPDTLSRTAYVTSDDSAGNLGNELNLSGTSVVCVGFTSDLFPFGGGTDWSPVTNDTATLGTATLNWSDLHLATGGTINWNNGTYTLSEVSGVLTGSGDFSIGTSNTLTIGDIELGAASDTTLARTAAGRATIEGVPVNTHTDSATAPSGPLDGDGWYDYDTGAYVKRLNDGATSAWVEVGVGASTLPLPAGLLVWQTASDTCTGNTLLANGATVSKATYPRLWSQVSVAGNLVTASATDGQYEDNEDGTFDLINLTGSNRFVRAADGTTLDVGDIQADGAPDITGTFSYGVVALTGTGAFSVSNTNNRQGGGGGANDDTVAFAASSSNANYGAASEIRPTNIALLPCITY